MLVRGGRRATGAGFSCSQRRREAPPEGHARGSASSPSTKRRCPPGRRVRGQVLTPVGCCRQAKGFCRLDSETTPAPVVLPREAPPPPLSTPTPPGRRIQASDPASDPARPAESELPGKSSLHCLQLHCPGRNFKLRIHNDDLNKSRKHVCSLATLLVFSLPGQGGPPRHQPFFVLQALTATLVP